MLQAAKLLIIDNEDKHLLLYRASHPHLGDDPDLPGGTLEAGESMLETMVREVDEEVGVVIDPSKVEKAYEGTGYSVHNSNYSLYVTKLAERPTLTLSWEHKSYEWVSREVFLEKCKNANDTYMHMVYDVLKD